MKKRIKTSRKKIVEYWSQYISEGELGTDWIYAENRCWRCGVERNNGNIDRCHIIPEQEPFNGKDEPSNFVLLCKRCHKEAPDVADKEIMIKWIKSTSSRYDGEYDANLAIKAFEEIFGIPPNEYLKSKKVPQLNYDTVSLENFQKEIFDLCEKYPVGTHSMQVSATSEAYRLKQIIDHLAEKD